MSDNPKKKYPYFYMSDIGYATDFAARMTSPKGTPESGIQKKRETIGLMGAVFMAAVVFVLIVAALIMSYIR